MQSPAQKTLQLQIDGNLESVAKLKHIICAQIGLPPKFDIKDLALSHCGKSLVSSSNGRFEAEKFHLSLIQVSMALPGGSRTSEVKKSQLGIKIIT